MIVVVDDTHINARLLARLLDLVGYPATPLFCGLDLLEYLDTHATPLLVILDITMPHMNGLECLGRLRANSEWQHIPVIMYSAECDDETVREAGRLGAEEYVVKGAVPWNEFLTKIQRYAVHTPLN